MNPLLVEEIEAKVREKYQNNKRLTHILGVARLAKELAHKFALDEDKAYVAGLLHDYIKYESVPEMVAMIDDEEIVQKFKTAPEIYHAYASKAMAIKIFNIKDEEILNAICYHVYGRKQMTLLEKILVVSDYAEDSRPYPSCKMVRRILDNGDFNLAIFLCLKYTINNLVKNGKTPIPEEYEILDELRKEVNGMDILESVRDALEKVKAKDITAYDLRGVSPLADFVVIATVDSARQANACIDYIEDFNKEGTLKIKNVEGKNSSWILIDLFDVIIHIFTEEERANYQLDKLYNQDLAFEL